jgi:hypothetical protein
MKNKPKEGEKYGTIRATSVVQSEVKGGPRNLNDKLLPVYPSMTERRGFLDRCCNRILAEGFRLNCGSLPSSDESSLADVVDALGEAVA